jgi:hypothetical protein
MGRKMAGQKRDKDAANSHDFTPLPSPPGHFLNSELQSDTARFLAELKTSISRREAARAGSSSA